MATRKPAASTLLKQAQAEIEKLNKELASCKSSLGYSQTRANEAQAEIEGIHAFFDSLPNGINRKADDGYTQRSAMTRMAAWLAARNQPAIGNF